MRKIREKLNNSRGASMIIAMVFMLTCLFVGGSVLTSATANANRIREMNQQQEYLNQRSAAMLVVSELDPIDRITCTKTVEKNLNTGEIQRHTIEISRSGSQSMTAMQRIVYEAAVQIYLSHEEVAPTLSGFTYEGGALTSTNDFWVQSQILSSSLKKTVEMEITPTPGVGESLPAQVLTSCEVELSCDEDYNLQVKFPGSSKLLIQMGGHYISTPYSETVVVPPEEKTPEAGNSETVPEVTEPIVIERTITITTIYWDDPIIQKGAKG